MKRHAEVLVALLIFVASAIGADLRGRITDASNAGIPARVTLTGDVTQTVRADEDGQYRFADVKPGMYTIEVRLGGFLPISQRVKIPPNGLKRDFILQVTCDETTICDDFGIGEYARDYKLKRREPLVAFYGVSDISRFKLPPAYFGKISVRQQ